MMYIASARFAMHTDFHSIFTLTINNIARVPFSAV